MSRGATLSRILTLVMAIALAIGPAFAQTGQEQADCGPDEICGQASTTGAWGMIALGMLFCMVGLLPSNKGDGDDAPKTKIPFFNMLQVRMEKETRGWRRLQWPVLGFAFIALGVATLLGWL